MSFQCRVLAIDGGGIRGIIPAYFLKELEARLGQPAYRCFDVVGGTSVGGIITYCLTSPMPDNEGRPWSAATFLQRYIQDREDSFVPQSNGQGEKAKRYGTNPHADPPNGIVPWFQSIFGTITLAQAKSQLEASGGPLPKQVFNTSYTINGASLGPYLFNWVDAAGSPEHDYRVWEAAWGGVAGLTDLPVAQLGKGTPGGSSAAPRWNVDGAAVANNPSLYALAQAARLGLFTDWREVLIVSLGTGAYSAGIQITGDGNWGLQQWILGIDTNGWGTFALVGTFVGGNTTAPDQQLQWLMPQGHYYRLQPSLPYVESTADHTEASNVSALLATAERFIAPGGPGHAAFEGIVQALGGESSTPSAE